MDQWAEGIWKLGTESGKGQEIIPRDEKFRHPGIFYLPQTSYIKFDTSYSDSFYGLWQPAFKAPAPLVIHTPGYGAEMSAHPALVERGYHVLHICPLGYLTPEGKSAGYSGDCWDLPVLPDTICSGGREGYRFWLANCVQAVEWARSQPDVLEDHLCFMGSSQGGGGALLLASIYQGQGVRCVGADEPFLTSHPLAAGRGAYHMTNLGLAGARTIEEGWFGAGLADTISHVHRLKDVPVLLTAGGQDAVCPQETIRDLFEHLSGDSVLYYIRSAAHGYTFQFMKLYETWLELYS